MTVHRGAFTYAEVSALAKKLPDSEADVGEVDMQPDWISCIDVGWHVDDGMPNPWSALVLIHGLITIESRGGGMKPKSFTLIPGDMVIMNIHREHRAYSSHLEAAFLLFYDFEKRPSKAFSLECLRDTASYCNAMCDVEPLKVTA